jgi:hypothetical protein
MLRRTTGKIKQADAADRPTLPVHGDALRHAARADSADLSIR